MRPIEKDFDGDYNEYVRHRRAWVRGRQEAFDLKPISECLARTEKSQSNEKSKSKTNTETSDHWSDQETQTESEVSDHHSDLETETEEEEERKAEKMKMPTRKTTKANRKDKDHEKAKTCKVDDSKTKSPGATGEYLVSGILDYNPKTEKLHIEWAAGDTTWEPIKSMRDSIGNQDIDEYLQEWENQCKEVEVGSEADKHCKLCTLEIADRRQGGNCAECGSPAHWNCGKPLEGGEVRCYFCMDHQEKDEFKKHYACPRDHTSSSSYKNTSDWWTFMGMSCGGCDKVWTTRKDCKDQMVWICDGTTVCCSVAYCSSCWMSSFAKKRARRARGMH